MRSRRIDQRLPGTRKEGEMCYGEAASRRDLPSALERSSQVWHSKEGTAVERLKSNIFAQKGFPKKKFSKEVDMKGKALAIRD